MAITVKVSGKVGARLWEYLLASDVEQAAFLFAEFSETTQSSTFVGRELYLVPPEDFDIQSSFHLAMTDEALARLIKRAWDLKLALVEWHSHPRYDGPASFSPSDRFGLRDMVPYVRWRLRGSPYAAVVISDASLDALGWLGDDPDPLGVDGIKVGKTVLKPSGISLARWNDGDV
jgi:hypothetical protein